MASNSTKCLMALNLQQGVVRQSSVMACDFGMKIIYDIFKLGECGGYSQVIMVNSQYDQNSHLFKYLPPMFQGSDRISFKYRESKVPNLTLLESKRLNCADIALPHLKNRDMEIHLCGFTASFAITSTIYGMIDLGLNVKIMPHLISDLSLELKNKALESIYFLGIENQDSSNELSDHPKALATT